MDKINHKESAGRLSPDRKVWFGFLCLLALISISANAAANEPSRSQRLKVAIIYKFLHYVHWPEETQIDGDQLKVCLLGEDPFQGALMTLKGRAVGHALKIQMTTLVNLTPTIRCQVLVIGSDQKQHLDTIRSSVSDQHILTISDFNKSDAQLGGILQLIEHDNLVSFSVNTPLARRAMLSIDARVLSLASEIIR
jgi:hypothetical protein